MRSFLEDSPNWMGALLFVVAGFIIGAVPALIFPIDPKASLGSFWTALAIALGIFLTASALGYVVCRRFMARVWPEFTRNRAGWLGVRVVFVAFWSFMLCVGYDQWWLAGLWLLIMWMQIGTELSGGKLDIRMDETRRRFEESCRRADEALKRQTAEDDDSNKTS